MTDIHHKPLGDGATTSDEIERAAQVLEGQSEILELISRAAPLNEILERIVAWVEGYGNGNALASVLLMHEDGKRLMSGVAPNLPGHYNQAINGVEIGPKVGSCGAAAYYAQQVVVEDIEHDERWKDFKDLALACGLRACWSSPLISRQGKVLGTFAIYYKYPHRPNKQDQELINLVSRTAIVAIEFHQIEQERASLMSREPDSIERSKQERTKFYELLMNAPAMICVLKGPNHVFELSNDIYSEAVGKGRPLVGLTVAEALPEVVDAGFIKILDMVYRTGQPYYGDEVSLKLDRKKNGNLEDRFLNFVYQPILDEHGKPEGIFVHGVDITDQVLARLKVQESEQRVRAVVESAPFPIGVYIGREMRIAMGNQSIIDVWGKGPDIIGKTYAEILPELKDQAIYEQLDKVYTTGTPFHARHQRVDLVVNGILQPFYFNYSFTPLFDATGAVYGVMNTAAEVTDLVLAQQRLAEARERLANAIDVAELGTWAYRLADSTITYSTRLNEWFGFDDGPVVLAEVMECIVPEDRPAVAKAIKEAINQRKAYEAEFDVVNKKTGERHILHAKGQLAFDHNGQPVNLNGTARDVTIEKMMQMELERQVELRTMELKKMNMELQQVNENLQQFAYVASHDLQEPLRKISIYSNMLVNSGKETLSTAGKSHLEKISKASRRMSDLIKDLLDFSRVQADQQSYIEVDLNKVIQEIKTDFEILLNQKNGSLEIAPLCTVQAVPLQMNQLFYNLIGNALKFSREGVEPKVIVSSRRLSKEEQSSYKDLHTATEYCEISVADNGIGFSDAYREQIFDIFQRLHTKEEFEGTGIGLALCKKITQSHGGDISASSVEGEGSVFRVILPVASNV